MHSPVSKKSIATAQENVCAILVLPNLPKNFSANDWYWKKICGVPFLLRNVINLQRAGLSSLIIYSDKNIDLYKRLCKEKNISLKVSWIKDITEVTKSTKSSSILILNGGALHERKEIESGANFEKGANQTFTIFLERETMAKTIKEITLDNQLSWVRPSHENNTDVKFLPGKKESCISKPRDFLVQHKNLLRSSGLNNDSFMDKTITRFFSRHLTRLFLKTPLSPNMITILSLFLGLVSAAFFLQGTYKNSMIGAGLLLLSAWIDCTDGEVARLKFLESKIGGKLDILCDNLVHFSVFFAIGMGLYQSSGDSIYIFLGAFAVLGSLISFLVLSVSIIDEKEKVSSKVSKKKVKNSLTDNLANRDFIYFLFLMAIIEKIDIFLWITAFGSNIFAGYLIYSKIKSTIFTG